MPGEDRVLDLRDDRLVEADDARQQPRRRAPGRRAGCGASPRVPDASHSRWRAARRACAPDGLLHDGRPSVALASADHTRASRARQPNEPLARRRAGSGREPARTAAAGGRTCAQVLGDDAHLASSGMKLVSPIQRGTRCQCRWSVDAGAGGAPRFMPTFMPSGWKTLAEQRRGAAQRLRRASAYSSAGRSRARRVWRRGATITCAAGIRIAVQHDDGGGRRASTRRARGSAARGARQKMQPGSCARPDVRHAPGGPEDLHAARPTCARRATCGVVGGSSGLPSTRSSQLLADLEERDALGGTGTRVPVFGLRPSRAWRCLTTKLPKPRISMRSPRASASVRLSNTALTMTSASRRENRG